VNDLDLALRSALDGVGIVQLPEALAAPYVADGRLLPVLSDWQSCWGSFCLYYSNRRHVPMALRNLTEFLRRESRNANPRRLMEITCIDDLKQRAPPSNVRHHDSLRANGRNSQIAVAISTK
jgi:hypothetical protein